MARAFKDLEICKNYVNKDKAKIIGAVELLLNKKSELNKIQNIDERKAEACRQSGLKSGPDIFDDEGVKDLIFHYLSYYQNSNEFQLLFNDQQLYWSLMKEMMSPADSEDKEKSYQFKLKISEQCSALLERIKIRFNNLYNVEELGTDIVEMVETKIRVLRPEERVIKKSS